MTLVQQSSTNVEPISETTSKTKNDTETFAIYD